MFLFVYNSRFYQNDKYSNTQTQKNKADLKAQIQTNRQAKSQTNRVRHKTGISGHKMRRNISSFIRVGFTRLRQNSQTIFLAHLKTIFKNIFITLMSKCLPLYYIKYNFLNIGCLLLTTESCKSLFQHFILLILRALKVMKTSKIFVRLFVNSTPDT